MGKLASWLGSTSSLRKSAPDSYYPPARVSGFDMERLRGFRAALNNRAGGTPQQDYQALASHMTGLVHVSVNLLATMVADSKMSLWQYSDTDPDGAKRLQRDDPISRLYAKPNAIDTPFDFFYDQAMQYELTGMALVWAPPDRNPNQAGAEIDEMWCLPRAGMILNPPIDGFPQGYWTALPYGMYSSPNYTSFVGATKIPAEQVMQFRKRSPLFRWEAYSVLSAMAQTITTFEGLETSRLAAMLQGCDQSIAVELGEGQSPNPQVVDGIKAAWFGDYAGPSNAGKLVFTSNGTKIHPFSTTPTEMGYVESFSQMADYLLAAYGTPKALVGMVDELTHSTLFGTLKANHLTKLRPLLNSLSACHTKFILEPFYSEEVFMKIEADAIHDDELLERQIDNDLRAGVRTVGELRRIRGLDCTGAPWESERAFAGGPKPQGPAFDGGEARDSETGELLDPDKVRDGRGERARPENLGGLGALGGSGSKSINRTDALLESFERLKTKGVVFEPPHKNGKVVIK